MVLRGLIDAQDAREIRKPALKLLRDTQTHTQLLVSTVALGEATQGLLADGGREGHDRFVAAMEELSKLHKRGRIGFCWIEKADKTTYALATRILDRDVHHADALIIACHLTHLESEVLYSTDKFAALVHVQRLCEEHGKRIETIA
jgi:hypothetical protein